MISIVIPACNEENYIKETLESIKAQTYKDYEIVVVCNGCNDNTEKIAKKYTNKVFSLKEGDVCKAKNFGAEKSNGEIIIFLDADTRFSENDVLENIAKKNIKIGSCLFKPDEKSFMFNLFTLFKNSFCWIGLANGNLICNKKVFNNIGGFNIFPSENYNLVKRAKKYGKFIVVKDYVVTSMRRHKRLGYFYLSKYWLGTVFSKKKKEYAVIR